MPKEQYAVRLSRESGAVHHVRQPRFDRLQESGIVSRVIFEICVLDQDDLSSNLRESRPQRSALAAIVWVAHDAHAPIRDPLQCRDDFEEPGGVEDAGENGLDRLLLVVDRDHHREIHEGWRSPVESNVRRSPSRNEMSGR